MTRSGHPIEDHHIQHQVNSNIQYSQKFIEFAACKSMGLDIERWQNFGYTDDLKADVIAFWELEGLVEINQQDAKNRKEESMNKKRR